MQALYMFGKALRLLRDEIGKKDMPVYWLEFFLMVAEAGETGATTKEIADQIEMGQGIASRMVKLLSRYYDHETGMMAGADLFSIVPDHIHRHRQRVFLSEHGKAVAKKIEEYLA